VLRCILILISISLQLGFDDVLAEPMAAQGFEWVWKLAFVVFTQTKLWLYRLFAAVVAIPAALVWALVFALITVVYVWFLSPAFRIFDLGVTCFRRVSDLFIFTSPPDTSVIQLSSAFKLSCLIFHSSSSSTLSLI
jgi:hypothetical protein